MYICIANEEIKTIDSTTRIFTLYKVRVPKSPGGWELTRGNDESMFILAALGFGAGDDDDVEYCNIINNDVAVYRSRPCA